MGILIKSQLIDLAKENELLGLNYLKDNFQSASYDLRIGTLYKDGKILSESHPNKKVYNVSIKPGEIVTMLTLEDVKIPIDCCATVFPINRMSSKGFLILNPGHIDPGFHGPLSICAINLSSKTEVLDLGKSIFTLILKRLDKTIEDEDDVYKSSFIRDKRKEYERNYLNNSFINLSNNIFDLVIGYKKAIIWFARRIWEILLPWLIVLATLMGINQGLMSFYPSLWRNTDNKIDIENKSLKKELIEAEILIDSLKKSNSQVKGLGFDSTNFLIKKDTLLK